MPPRRRGRAARKIPIESEGKNEEGERSIPVRRPTRQVDDEMDVLAALMRMRWTRLWISTKGYGTAGLEFSHKLHKVHVAMFKGRNLPNFLCHHSSPDSQHNNLDATSLGPVAISLRRSRVLVLLVRAVRAAVAAPRLSFVVSAGSKPRPAEKPGKLGNNTQATNTSPRGTSGSNPITDSSNKQHKENTDKYANAMQGIKATTENREPKDLNNSSTARSEQTISSWPRRLTNPARSRGTRELPARPLRYTVTTRSSSNTASCCSAPAVELCYPAVELLFEIPQLPAFGCTSISCIGFARLSTVLCLLYCCSPYWGLTTRSLWGRVLLPAGCTGFPGFTAGRGFDPAGGAPGGG
ncbi:ABC transporter D family member 1-like [Dorcoceras hygrometricum]|uniref:ABC transporter D family member 1-like n=1 Tax=Dorcoceras hygrometricum TaxID=472368 RepID=A0A2Z7B7Z8_9LAMI|nr:ABC transporter D family member 1-like [Dorcoceras hygrometricum]